MSYSETVQSPPHNGTWKSDLLRAARLAKLEVVGIDDVVNEAQARVGIALLKAFGEHPGGFLYFEPCTARSSHRPPDAVLCHPETGVLVFEVKGYPISNIERISGGSFQVRCNGYTRCENPFQQVRRRRCGIGKIRKYAGLWFLLPGQNLRIAFDDHALFFRKLPDFA